MDLYSICSEVNTSASRVRSKSAHHLYLSGPELEVKRSPSTGAGIWIGIIVVVVVVTTFKAVQQGLR